MKNVGTSACRRMFITRDSAGVIQQKAGRLRHHETENNFKPLVLFFTTLCYCIHMNEHSFPPRSLRFDELTEERLKFFGQLKGQSVSSLIRELVDEGIATAFQPALLEAHAQKVNAMAAQLGVAARLEVVQETQTPEAPQA